MARTKVIINITGYIDDDDPAQANGTAAYVSSSNEFTTFWEKSPNNYPRVVSKSAAIYDMGDVWLTEPKIEVITEEITNAT